MSLKLPRNWDFNLRAEAVKIGKVKVQVFPWGLLCVTTALHAGRWELCQSEPCSNSELSVICIQVYVLSEVPTCWEGVFFYLGVGCVGQGVFGWSQAVLCMQNRPFVHGAREPVLSGLERRLSAE